MTTIGMTIRHLHAKNSADN